MNHHPEDCPCEWTHYEIVLLFRALRNRNFNYDDYKRYYTLIYGSAEEAPRE